METNEDEQQSIPQNNFQNPLNQFGGSIVMMTDPSNELHAMELTFRSSQEDSEGNLVPLGDPMMNEKGISSVLGTVQALINRVTIMSNLEKNEVPMLIDFLSDTLAKDLMMNRKEYGIDSGSVRDRIYYTALSTTFVTLKRAYMEGDKRFWKGTVQEIHQHVDNNKRKGIFSSLNPWSK